MSVVFLAGSITRGKRCRNKDGASEHLNTNLEAWSKALIHLITGLKWFIWGLKSPKNLNRGFSHFGDMIFSSRVKHDFRASWRLSFPSRPLIPLISRYHHTLSCSVLSKLIVNLYHFLNFNVSKLLFAYLRYFLSS